MALTPARCATSRRVGGLSAGERGSGIVTCRPLCRASRATLDARNTGMLSRPDKHRVRARRAPARSHQGITGADARGRAEVTYARGQDSTESGPGLVKHQGRPTLALPHAHGDVRDGSHRGSHPRRGGHRERLRVARGDVNGSRNRPLA
ncbi:hypothetical protein GCM10010277_61490 [Streptomyces longisporoflavus]|nr:hypothetical protein GCM10010277_61490 [Streptomyces longisporoflavus]